MERLKIAFQKLNNAIRELFTTIKKFISSYDQFIARANKQCHDGLNPCMEGCPVAYSCRMTRQRRLRATRQA